LTQGCSHFTNDEPYLESKQFNRISASFHNSNGKENSKNFAELFSYFVDFLLRPADPAETEGFPLNHEKRQSKTSRPSLTWIGHSSLLVRIRGKTILTDPVFSKRASPFSLIGPRRIVPPAFALNELPEIDFVVISHSHYDHLDLKTVRYLATRNKTTTFFVPLGLKKLLESVGATEVFELDWWDQVQTDDLTFIATPAHHWSARTFFDRNKTLWSSWMITSENFKFFFAGDTGYSSDFKEIKKNLGSPDVAAIPIGAYAPRAFMKGNHVNPTEAVNIFQDLQAKTAIAIHWGTFKLSTEPLREPPEKLRSELERRNIKPDRFIILNHGETLIPD